MPWFLLASGLLGILFGLAIFAVLKFGSRES